MNKNKMILLEDKLRTIVRCVYGQATTNFKGSQFTVISQSARSMSDLSKLDRVFLQAVKTRLRLTGNLIGHYGKPRLDHETGIRPATTVTVIDFKI